MEAQIKKTQFNYGMFAHEEIVAGTLEYFSKKVDRPIKNNKVTIRNGQYTIVYEQLNTK
jgi:hypothetical protein